MQRLFQLYKPCAAALGGILLTAFSLAATADDQEFDPTQVKGDLQKIKEPLSQLFKLNTTGGRLSAEVEKNRQTAYQEINKINALGGNRGGGSSSSGSNWEIRINNNSFEGICNFGYSRVYPKPNPNTWKIRLKELKEPNRDLFVEADPDGEISITLYGGDDPYLLRIRQRKSGSIFVQEVSDTQIFSESAPSFDVFCRRHARFTQNRLLPMIRHLGFDPPMTQFDSAVQQSVISFLTPIQQDRLASFQTSFRNLDSPDYDARQADAKKLSDAFEDWRDFVMRAVNDSEFSFEVRFRLMEALEKNGKPEEIQASRFAISSGLADNPEYLVWLYDMNSDADVRENILAQLRETTGQDLGEDIARWKARFQSSPVDPGADREPPVDLLAEKGAIDTVTEYVGQLVRIQVEDDKLHLDRKHWSEQFGGKTIQQLVKETNENLAKLNMPANYDPDPLFELETVGHPQAIFAKMRSELQSESKSTTVYYHSYSRTTSSTLNREFHDEKLNVTMDFEPHSQTVRRVAKKNLDAKPPELDDKPFKLDFREADDTGRSLMVHQQPDGHLRLAIVTEKSNAFVQMLQRADGGFVVQDVRGPDIFTAKGQTFSQFFQQHETYCREKLFPLFSHFGVSFSPELFDAPAKRPAETAEETAGADKETASNRSRVENRVERAIAPRARLAIPRGAIRPPVKK